MNNKERLSISYYGSSDIGMVRKENQDSFGKYPTDDLNLYSEKGQLFIVADGMGGHAGGKEASSIAVNTIQKVYFSESTDSLSALKKAIAEANYNVYNKSQNSDQFRGMGTTCTVLLLKENKGLIAHIGDSKIYLVENNSSKKIEQLTEDHTKVHEMIKKGILTKEEAEVYPAKSVLSRALGVDPEVQADFKTINIKKEQSYILCSDGLTGVSNNEILQIVTSNSPEYSCKRLIELANERSGKDNVTVLVAKVGLLKPLFLNESNHAAKKKKNFILPVIITLFLLIAATFGLQYRSELLQLFKPNKIQNPSGEISVSKDNKEPSSAEKSDRFENLQLQADNLYKKGRLESAFIIYKKILSEKPMHLGALQGINNIAADYTARAEKYKNSNNINEALNYYKKALNIQPANQRLLKLISECETKLNH